MPSPDSGRAPAAAARTEAPLVCVIGGSGRSGTSILSKTFGQHSAVAGLSELRFMTDPDGLLDFVNNESRLLSTFHRDLAIRRLEAVLSAVAKPALLGRYQAAFSRSVLAQRLPRTVWARYPTVSATDELPGFVPATERLLERLEGFRFEGHWVGQAPLSPREIRFSQNTHAADEAAIREFLEWVMSAAAVKHEATHYLEKNTWNILWFDRLLDLVPRARLVHMIRDPRDVVDSLMHQTWAPSDLQDCARFYGSLMDRWEKQKANLQDDTFLEIRLEDLTAEPEQTIRQIENFWELPHDNRLVGADFSRANHGRWRTSWTDAESKMANKMLAPFVEAYGYAE